MLCSPMLDRLTFNKARYERKLTFNFNSRKNLIILAGMHKLGQYVIGTKDPCGWHTVGKTPLSFVYSYFRFTFQTKNAVHTLDYFRLYPRPCGWHSNCLCISHRIIVRSPNCSNHTDISDRQRTHPLIIRVCHPFKMSL